jgi:hypothetical protein
MSMSSPEHERFLLGLDLHLHELNKRHVPTLSEDSR